LRRAGWAFKPSDMRDLDTIDSELRLLLAIRQMVREEEGRPPSTARIDELLDERSAGSAAAQAPRVQNR
jgi:hypothetical protein